MCRPTISRTMARFWACWAVCVFSLGLFPTSTQAQNLLDVLLGQGQSNGQLEIKTPEAKQLIKAKERQKETARAIERFRLKNKERISLWGKEIALLRAMIGDYPVLLTPASWRNASDLVQLRTRLLVVAEQNAQQLSKLQVANASREQNLLSLRDVINNYLKTRKAIDALIQARYVKPKHRESLEKDLQKVLKKNEHSRQQLKESKQELQQLSQAYEDNQKKLDESRRKLVQLSKKPLPLGMVSSQKASRDQPRVGKKKAPKVGKKNSPATKKHRRKKATTQKAVPTRKRAPQPTSKQAVQKRTTEQTHITSLNIMRMPTDEEILKLQKQQYTQQLEGMIQKLYFDSYRWKGLWLRIRQRDEGVEQHVLAWKLQLYSLLVSKMRQALSQMKSYSRTGLLFRRKLQLNRVLFGSVWKHTKTLIKQAPREWKNLKEKLKWGWESLNQAGTLLLLFLAFLGLIGLVFLTKSTRARLESSMKQLSDKVESSKVTKVFWLTLLVVFRSIYQLLPFFGLLVIIGSLLWALETPSKLQTLVWGVGSTWLGLFAFHMLSKQLFSADAETRLFRNVDDQGARRYRRVIGTFIGIASLYIPVIFAGRMLGYSTEFLHILTVAFYGFLVLCLLLLLLSQNVVLSMIPADSVLGRAVMLMIYRVYPIFFLLVLGLFGIYAYGYINLAAYLGWSILLTLVVIGLAIALYRFLWSFGLVLFGFSRESEGFIKIEKKWARNLLRLMRFLSGIVLGLVGLSLLLEIWGVAGGFRTLIRLFNTPFLQVKDTQLTVVSLLKFILSLTASVLIARWLKQKSNQFVYPALRLSRSNQHAANTVLLYSIWTMGFLAGLQWMGMGLGVLTVFASVLAIGVGFGLQNIASNFISGLIVTFGKPIKVGDLIEVGGLMGEVKEVSARSTTIETYDFRIVLIPNSEILTTKVVNWSMGQPFIMAKLAVGVAYGSDVPLVIETLKLAAQDHPKVLKEPKAIIRFGDFGASSLDFSLWVAVRDPLQRFEVLSDLRIDVDRRFRELEITIAFPQQDIHFDEEFQSAILQSLQDKKPSRPA